MAHLEFKFLGGFEVVLDNKRITAFESDKVRALIAYLAVESSHAHRREKLAALLWTNLPEKRARQNLSQALYALRASLGERGAKTPILVSTPGQIELCKSDICQVDILEFQQLIRSCEQHSHRRAETCPRCASQLVEAVAFYEGCFLDGFSLSDNPSFEEWVLVQRERLQRMAEYALGTLAKHCAVQNNYSDAIQFARRQIEIDPWRESAHRQLMQFLALDGQRSAALAQYETCHNALNEDLGVTPQPKTKTLYKCIRDGEIGPMSFSTSPNNLPAPLTPFIGRDAEMMQLRKLLNDPACRLITLVGMGGSGKTRLALEAARAELPSYPDGVCLVRLSQLQKARAMVTAMADCLKFSFHESGDPCQQILGYLREKSILLILDNFEHLLDGVDLVLEILRSSPGITVLATSRTRLNAKGEHIQLVAGLAFPEREVELNFVGDADDFSAIQLFVDSARRAHPGFILTPENAPGVVSICSQAQGMPLAILLASTWVGQHSPAEIAAQIQEGFDILESAWRDLPTRQRSMRAVLGHSWDLLNKREQDLMQGLSIFRGGFTQEAAQQILSSSAQTIQGLVNKSYLQPNLNGRYEIHTLTRQYAEEKLAQLPEYEKHIRDQHSIYYMMFLQQSGDGLKGPRQQTILQEMDTEIENVRAAWCWAINRLWVNRVDLAIEALGLYHDFRVRFQDGECLCQDAIAGLSTFDGAPSRTITKVKIWLAHFKWKLEYRESALQLYSDCWSELTALGKRTENAHSEKALTLLGMGRVIYRSTYGSAKNLFQQSLEIYRKLKDPWWEAVVLNALGNGAVVSSQYKEAKGYFERSFKIRSQLGDERCMASSLHGMSVNAQFLGNLVESERLICKANQIRKKIGIQSGLIFGKRRLADILTWKGCYEESRLLFEQNIKESKHLGLEYNLIYSSILFGFSEMFYGMYERSNSLVKRSIFKAKKYGYTREQGFSFFVLGGIAIAEGKYQKAEIHLNDSYKIFQDLNMREELTWVMFLMSFVACELGRVAQAWNLVYDGFHTSVQIGTFMSKLIGLPILSFLLLEQADVEMAVEIYTLARSYPFVGGSQWFEDIIGKSIAEATTSLRPALVAAAEERGRHRNLDETLKEILAELEGEITMA